MAYDKVVDSALLDAAMAATAESIRSKGGTAEKIAWDSASGFAKAVEALPSGGSSSVGNVQVTLSVSEGVNNTISDVYASEVLDNGTIKTSTITGDPASTVFLEIASGSCFIVAFTSNYINELQTDGIEILALLNGYNMESFALVCHVTAAAGDSATLTI